MTWSKIFSKNKLRLRRQTVLTAGRAVQTIKRVRGGAGVKQLDDDPRRFGLADVAPGAGSETTADSRGIRREVEPVNEVGGEGRLGVQQLPPAPQLDALPALRAAVFDHALPKLPKRPAAADRRAKVGERQRHPAAAGDKAVDLHDRDQALETACIYDGEIERRIPIGFPQHAGPGGGVEKGSAGGAEKQVVPVWVGSWVDDLYFRQM